MNDPNPFRFLKKEEEILFYQLEQVAAAADTFLAKVTILCSLLLDQSCDYEMVL